MNKRYKLLSLLLCAGIVASAFPNSGTGATSESIAFYNSKKSILEMESYDEAYDTNHDGVVNVFDVIRENKEVFQEESYTDLKAQIHSLETQIEILTQKLIEKEDKTQAESDLSEINSVLSGKVDQQDGKQLSSNDYTDEEKKKLECLNNYDDTLIKNNVSELSESILEKVNKEEGKLLSSNDYTDEEKNKLASLENYNDSEIKSDISNINSELSSMNDVVSGKVDKQEGKQLSSNDYTDEEKHKLESLSNYDDTKVKSEISDVKRGLSELSKIAITKETVVVDKEGNGDYTTLKEAVEFSYNHANVTILVNKGIYNLIEEFGESYFSNLPESQNAGLKLANNVKIIFDSDSKVICHYTGENENVLRDFSPFNACTIYATQNPMIHKGFYIENLTLECSRVRYAVHDECIGQNDSYKNEYVNCRMIKDNTQNDIFTPETVIGGGLGSNSEIVIQNCYFSGKRYGSDQTHKILASYHGTTNDYQKSNVYVTNCYFDEDSTFRLGYMGTSDKITYGYISNNSFGYAPFVSSEIGEDIVNMEIVAWNNEIRN